MVGEVGNDTVTVSIIFIITTLKRILIQYQIPTYAGEGFSLFLFNKQSHFQLHRINVGFYAVPPTV